MIFKINEQKNNLVEAEKATTIAGFTRMVAHDIRRPLNLIKMLLDIDKESPENSIPGDFKNSVESAINNAKSMLDDIRSYNSEIILKREVVDPKHLLESSLSNLESFYSAKNITIEKYYNHSRNISVDPNKMQRVFTNIIDNAFEAIGEGSGKIIIETSDEKNGFTCSIKNTGSFIPEHELTKIFEPGFSSKQKSGRGLGLMIAKKFVEVHNGAVRCISDEKESFTLFEVSIYES